MSFRLFDEDNVKPYLVSAFFDILFSTASICVVQGFLYWGFRGSPPPNWPNIWTITPLREIFPSRLFLPSPIFNPLPRLKVNFSH